jgi:hypothetical protein
MKIFPAKLPLFGSTFVRYLLAVFFALLSYFLICDANIFIELPFHLILAIIGFVGVLFPSFILPSQSRVRCAIFLTLLLTYRNSISWTWDLSLIPRIPETLQEAFYLLSPFCGGLAAIGIHFFYSRPNARSWVIRKIEASPTFFSFGSASLRYGLAAFCAYLLSMIIANSWIFPSSDMSMYSMIVVMGFASIFLPSFIVPRQSRVACAIFLLLFLVLLENCYLYIFSVSGSDNYEAGYDRRSFLQVFLTLLIGSLSLSFISGGLIAMGIHYFLVRHKKRDKQ